MKKPLDVQILDVSNKKRRIRLGPIPSTETPLFIHFHSALTSLAMTIVIIVETMNVPAIKSGKNIMDSLLEHR